MFDSHRAPRSWIGLVTLVLTLLLAIVGCGRSDIGVLDLGSPDDSAVDTVDGGDAGTLLSITIDPASATIPTGATETFKARGLYSDGTTGDVSATAKWSTDDATVASVDAKGIVTAKATGATALRATIGSIVGVANVKVPASPLTALRVDPPAASTAVGGTVAYTATAMYADGSFSDATKLVTWSTLDISVATIDASGVATAVASGTTTVRATLLTITGNATLSVVSKPIVRIDIAPSSPILGVGVSLPLTATAVYSDGSTAIVTTSATWSSSAPGIASIVAGPGAGAGVVSGVSAGSAMISATFSGVTGSTPVTVPAGKIVSIAISPASADVPIGGIAFFIATATYSDGSTGDVTTSALWLSGDGTIAVVSGGVATGIAAGATTITASLGGVSGIAKISVSSATLVSIAITPVSPTTSVGVAVAFKATGTYSDGTTKDITADVLWSTDDPTVATISNAPGSKGIAAPIAAGKTVVRATLSGVVGTATLVVTGGTKTLVSITVTPASATIPKGASMPFTATALYSDGSTADVTTTATWSSSDSTIANVDATGKVTALSPGSVAIAATIGSISGAAKVFVPSATLTSIRVDPTPASTAVGGAVTFTATALYSDGTSSDVTSSAVWSVDDPTVATLAGNVATGVGGGTTTVRATLTGVVGTASLTVSAKTIKSIDLTPFNPTVGVGVLIAFKATATYTDGSTADVTSSATWSSSDPKVASVIASGAGAGNATSLSAGTTVISATFSGVVGTTSLTVTSSPLVGISISPSTATISIGGKVTLVATATYADGSTADVTATAVWTSSDATIATVSTGNVIGVGAGTATMTASFGGKSGTASITVSAATLKSITITPADPSLALGGTILFKATGLYSDGSTLDITTSVVWSTDDATIATVSNAAGSQGKATPVAAGKTSVHATFGSIVGTTSLTVSSSTLVSIALAPNPLALVTGDKQLLKATGTYSDGSKLDLSTTCTWSTANAAVAVVSNAAGAQGQVTGVGAGSTTISCTQSGVSGSATVSVSSPTTASVSVTPISPTCHVGDVLQFTAMAISSGGTSTNVTFAATWSTSDATILAPVGAIRGRYRCNAVGTATVTATYGGKSGSSTATVTSAVVTSVQVDPAALSLAPATVQQYTATAFYSDGTSANVTGNAGTAWVSSSPSVASISTAPGSKGRATTIAAGTTTITATFGGVSGSTTLTVTSATIVSISITPAARSAPVGTIFNYTAQAIYSDGTSKDVTALATWSSSGVTIAQVSDAAASKGRATCLSAGSVTITATYSGVSGTASLTVTAATLTSIQVTPFVASVPVGIPVAFRADAFYSDGTSTNVTGLATWTSSDSSIAAVSDAAGSKGDTQTFKAGTATIKATWSGMSGTATLTVTTAKLTSIQLFPFKPSIPVGYGIGLTATALYDDGSTFDVTGLATWTSSAPSIAAVSDAGGSKGRVTPIAAGTATISATWKGTTGTDVVTVTSATLSSIAIGPSPATVAVGGNQQLVATGTFSDGTTLDITVYVGWSSSDTTVADVSNAAGTKGLAYGFKAGSVTVTATRGTVKGTAALGVK